MGLMRKSWRGGWRRRGGPWCSIGNKVSGSP